MSIIYPHADFGELGELDPVTDFVGNERVEIISIRIKGLQNKTFNVSNCPNLHTLAFGTNNHDQIKPGSVLLLDNLFGCNTLSTLAIRYPCTVDLSSLDKTCPQLCYLDLYKVASDKPLPISPHLRWVELWDCTFPSVSELPNSLIYFKATNSQFVLSGSLPLSLQGLSIYGRQVPKITPSSGSSGSLKIQSSDPTKTPWEEDLKSLVNLKQINFSGLVIQSGLFFPRNSIVKMENCNFTSGIKINGFPKSLWIVKTDQSVENISAFIGELSGKEVHLVGYNVDSACLKVLATHANSLFIANELIGEFPDLSQSPLKELTIGKLPDVTSIPPEFLPRKLRKH